MRRSGVNISECVLTTPSRILDHKHCIFRYTPRPPSSFLGVGGNLSCSIFLEPPALWWVSQRRENIGSRWTVRVCVTHLYALTPGNSISAKHITCAKSYTLCTQVRNTTSPRTSFPRQRNCRYYKHSYLARGFSLFEDGMVCGTDVENFWGKGPECIWEWGGWSLGSVFIISDIVRVEGGGR